MAKKIFITGGSGYFGTQLCREMEKLDWVEAVDFIDVKKPIYKFQKSKFKLMDINDPALSDWLSKIKPDIVIHLAYILEEIHDKNLMFKINVQGTKNILKACAQAKVPQILLASSATAYGAYPDNPIPLKEHHPLNPNPDFIYAFHKKILEDLCQNYLQEHPETCLSIIRPCVVYGPNVNNYLSDLFDFAILPIIRAHHPPLQFIHQDDLIQAILTIIQAQGKGAFNLAPPDTLTIMDIVQIAKKPYISFPLSVAKIGVGLLWNLRIPRARFSPGFLSYFAYPWVVDSSKIQSQLGFKFLYSSRETIEIMLRVKKIIP